MYRLVTGRFPRIANSRASISDRWSRPVFRALQLRAHHTLALCGHPRGASGESEPRPSHSPEFATIQELAEAVDLAERHVSRQLRLAYLAPEVLKRLTCGREASSVCLYDLCFLAGETWQEPAERAFR